MELNFDIFFVDEIRFLEYYINILYLELDGNEVMLNTCIGARNYTFFLLLVGDLCVLAVLMSMSFFAYSAGSAVQPTGGAQGCTGLHICYFFGGRLGSSNFSKFGNTYLSNFCKLASELETSDQIQQVLFKTFSKRLSAFTNILSVESY